MLEYVYFMRKSATWCIRIRIIAEILDYDKYKDEKNVNKVTNGIWIKFADKSLFRREKFYKGDMPYLIKGLKLIGSKFKLYGKYENSLVIIHSLTIIPTDFQEEGLTAAIIGWASKVLGFYEPKINVEYDKENNRYVYDFEKFEEYFEY